MEKKHPFLKAAERRAAKSMPQNKRKNWTRAFFELYRDLPERERQARSVAYALLREPLHVADGAWFTGQFYQQWGCDLGGSDFDPRWKPFDCSYVAERRALAEIPEFHLLAGKAENGVNPSWIAWPSCAPGHIGWRWDWIIESGVDGLLKRIAGARKGADREGVAFLDGCRILLEALLEWNDRHLRKLETLLARTSDPAGRRILRRKIAAVKRVPRRGARNFHEALQSFHFT